MSEPDQNNNHFSKLDKDLIVNDIKNLSANINNAQSSILRCKATLKNIEDGLLNLSGEELNSNCNNTGDQRNIIECYEPVELSAEPVNHGQRNGRVPVLPYPRTKPLEYCRNHEIFDESIWDCNTCNIGGELTCLLRAQQRLICQIERLQCEIGDKSGLIDGCVKDTHYLSCRMKEVQCELDNLHRELAKVRQEVAAISSKDRGFSPYANPISPSLGGAVPNYLRQDLIDIKDCDSPRASSSRPTDRHQRTSQSGRQPSIHSGGVLGELGAEAGASIAQKNGNISHMGGGTAPVGVGAGNIHVNLRDSGNGARTFEDMLRRSRLDMDCNVNNCRNNNQVPPKTELSKLKHKSPGASVLLNPLMKDFASLTNQIKGLRKMAETIFHNSCNVLVDGAGHAPYDDVTASTDQAHSPDDNAGRVPSNSSPSNNEQQQEKNQSVVTGDDTKSYSCTSKQHLAETTLSMMTRTKEGKSPCDAINHQQHQRRFHLPYQQVGLMSNYGEDMYQLGDVSSSGMDEDEEQQLLPAPQLLLHQHEHDRGDHGNHDLSLASFQGIHHQHHKACLSSDIQTPLSDANNECFQIIGRSSVSPLMPHTQHPSRRRKSSSVVRNNMLAAAATTPRSFLQDNSTYTGTSNAICKHCHQYIDPRRSSKH